MITRQALSGASFPLDCGGLRHPQFPHAENFPMKTVVYQGKIGGLESRTECQKHPQVIDFIETRGGVPGPANPAFAARADGESPTPQTYNQRRRAP